MLGERVYVYGGLYYEALSSIEYYDAEHLGRGWVTLNIEGLQPQVNPCFCPISSKKLLVFGGWQKTGLMIVDTKRQTTKQLITQEDIGLQFEATLSQPIMVDKGTVIAFVRDIKDKLHVVKYLRETNELFIVAEDLRNNDGDISYKQESQSVPNIFIKSRHARVLNR